MKKNIYIKKITALLSIVGISLASNTVIGLASNQKYIGETKAKEIALKDAKLSASKVNFVKVKLDTDDGVKVYDVEFYSGNKEYDYEIDAKTGNIREKDFDIENYTIKKQNTKKSTTKKQSGLIGETKAKEIALKDANLSASKVNFIKVKLDTDDGVKIYDVEFYSGNKEYDYEIDAKTGNIREKDFDIENYTIKSQSPKKSANKKQAKSGLIGEAKAKSIALSSAGLSNATITKLKLTTDDGRQIYDVEFYLGNTEYDYEIDAKTGAILESDVDTDD